MTLSWTKAIPFRSCRRECLLANGAADVTALRSALSEHGDPAEFPDPAVLVISPVLA